ncbi:MAG: ion transporter [Prosthecochloris sp.]|uniref:Ion transport protein n=1 Tax=Prosthecochloris aestuarii (strain DSM 271 / SK 413) TaxID=290512 RepID=B4S3W4_PROA2|nr:MULTISPECIES: ion transporter [Prosthecochloris]ACF45310.1 Ion transport protein [Prosthecochloris aestuarii DSM 271]MCW8798376.1 ion transporter [Prosthecochloris sp.]RDD31042.1 ion transporter [Prosthecochloris sp. ZM]
MTPRTTFKQRLAHIIFDYDTFSARLFDLLLIAAILMSVLIVMLDSVAGIHSAYGDVFYVLEWTFTILFTVEYFMRQYVAKDRLRYTTSFFGVIDLLSILPTYFSIFFPGTQYLLVIRFFRVLRVFRLLKLVKFVKEGEFVKASIIASARKIVFFLFFILVTVCIIGALMYLIEGEENGFHNIPEGVYWAIVTITTVGYGDIYPQTIVGRALAAFLMIMGYSVIAVPTGIVSAEMAAIKDKVNTDLSMHASCCESIPHDDNAKFCKECGRPLSR